MRRPLVAGNWKMNGSLAMAAELLAGVRAGLSGNVEAEVLICPPACLLANVVAQCSDTEIRVGGQNVSQYSAGAYTGELSAAMLRDAGCHYAIVGHSERRELFTETDRTVAEKAEAALEGGLRPIVCCGETLTQRQNSDTEAVIAKQIDAVVEHIGMPALTDAVIAYEPVWAIGTGETATPAQAQAVHEFIRARLAKLDAGVAAGLRILYGGSVKAGNAAELFACPDIDGGLIGGASLDAEEFLGIIAAAGAA